MFLSTDKRMKMPPTVGCERRILHSPAEVNVTCKKVPPAHHPITAQGVVPAVKKR